MRSRGTLRPRRTFSRNGITSSIPSGPPNETTNSASYFMYEVYQRNHIFHRRLRQDPVAQVEDVTRTTIRLVQNPFRLRAQHPLISKQHNRIEVTHHRHIMTNAFPSFIESHAPVEPDNITTGFAHHFEQRR